MRYELLLLATWWVQDAQAQVATSVQDGDWNDPATWDCTCVPVIIDAVVTHTVQITTNISLQHVHVMPSGTITMDGPHSVAIMDTVINDGVMHLIGNVDVDWALFNNGLITVNGDHANDGLLLMGGPNALLHTLNLGNAGTIDGTGRICVDAISHNTGTVQGQIDLCDATPTTMTPPIIDYNTGTVAGTVTFCLTGTCGLLLGTPEPVISDPRAWPVPTSDHLVIGGLPLSGCSVELLDACGKMVQAHSTKGRDQLTLDTTGLPAGLYHATISSNALWRSLTIAITR
jgi:hypothetical protein